METPNGKIEDERFHELQRFREEIEAIKKSTPSLSEVNVDELTDEDMELWKLKESGNATREAIDAHRKSISNEKRILREEIPRSRSLFFQYVANEVSQRITREELAKRRRNKK